MAAGFLKIFPVHRGDAFTGSEWDQLHLAERALLRKNCLSRFKSALA